jgi:hypothetical protein
VSAPETEGWVEVKAPMVLKEEPECSLEPDEDGVPVSAARAGPLVRDQARGATYRIADRLGLYFNRVLINVRI